MICTIVENTKEMRQIRNVAATMAISEMPVSEDLVKELIKVSKGEKTTEGLIKEITEKYTKISLTTKG